MLTHVDTCGYMFRLTRNGTLELFTSTGAVKIGLTVVGIIFVLDLRDGFLSFPKHLRLSIFLRLKVGAGKFDSTLWLDSDQ